MNTNSIDISVCYFHMLRYPYWIFEPQNLFFFTSNLTSLESPWLLIKKKKMQKLFMHHDWITSPKPKTLFQSKRWTEQTVAILDCLIWCMQVVWPLCLAFFSIVMTILICKIFLSDTFMSWDIHKYPPNFCLTKLVAYHLLNPYVTWVTFAFHQDGDKQKLFNASSF